MKNNHQGFNKPKDAAFCMYEDTFYRMQYNEEDHFVMLDEERGEEIEIKLGSKEFALCKFYKLVEF